MRYAGHTIPWPTVKIEATTYDLRLLLNAAKTTALDDPSLPRVVQDFERVLDRAERSIKEHRD